MKIIFFGTPGYVLPILESLHKEYNRGLVRQLVGVVTQKPKPAGRDQQVTYSEVDHFAHKHHIPIYFEFEDLPEDLDLGICAAYGRIIPDFVINNFKHGILNIHPSLLPQWRGASPIQATILSGETQTGLSVIKMDEEMDHGPVVSSFKAEVLPTDTNETLRARLFTESAQFLMDLLPRYLEGKIKLKPQDEALATYTKPLTKEDGFIPAEFISSAIAGRQSEEVWPVKFIKNQAIKPSARSIEQYIKAVTPWPGAWTFVHLGEEKKRIKILSAHSEEANLMLDEVQLEGKNQVSWLQFKQGYPTATIR